MKIAKKLKKNNVAVDIVSFGSEAESAEKLEAFHAGVNSNDNSHLVTVPPGTILSDMLFGTPIFMEPGAAPRSESSADLGAGELCCHDICCIYLGAALAASALPPLTPACPPVPLSRSRLPAARQRGGRV